MVRSLNLVLVYTLVDEKMTAQDRLGRLCPVLGRKSNS